MKQTTYMQLRETTILKKNTYIVQNSVIYFKFVKLLLLDV